MKVVLFRSRLRGDAGADYAAKAAEMIELARRMPGFVDFRSYEAEDGERLAVSWWEDDASVRGFREHPDHRETQRLGRERWYACFELDVADVERSLSFAAPPDPHED
jgi:heme-degrading monooxygenase HmoA